MNKNSKDNDKEEVSRNAIRPNSQRAAKDKNSALRSPKYSAGMKDLGSGRSSTSSTKSSKY